jgi:hypothetical protein
MKFDIVAQQVRILPEQSLASSLVVKSTGRTGNGSPKLDGSRAQGLY